MPRTSTMTVPGWARAVADHSQSLRNVARVQTSTLTCPAALRTLATATSIVPFAGVAAGAAATSSNPVKARTILRTVEGHQRLNCQSGFTQAVGTAKLRQVDDEGGSADDRSGLAQQAEGGDRGSP